MHYILVNSFITSIDIKITETLQFKKMLTSVERVYNTMAILAYRNGLSGLRVLERVLNFKGELLAKRSVDLLLTE